MREALVRTLENLKKNRFETYHVSDVETLQMLLKTLIPMGKTVGFGGSMTLYETGVIDALRAREDITLLDRDAHPELADSIVRDCFYADTFLMSSNAITETGVLYNVDGRGNRVAALTFGPREVIVIAGVNKIVPDEAAAIERVRAVAAPKNCVRLSRKTPCVKTGHCMNCDSPDRICSQFVFTKKQPPNGRIKVILIDGEWGY